MTTLLDGVDPDMVPCRPVRTGLLAPCRGVEELTGPVAGRACGLLCLSDAHPILSAVWHGLTHDDQEPGQVTTDEAVDVAGCACVKAKAVLEECSAFEKEQRTGLIDCTLQSPHDHRGRR